MELCENMVTIEGTEEALNSFVRNAFKNNRFSMENIDFEQEEDEVCLTHWGTISDVENVLVKIDDKTTFELSNCKPKKKIFIKYDTELSPNIEFWSNVASLFENLVIGHVYYCTDLEYAGVNEYKKNTNKEYYVENSHSNYNTAKEYFDFILGAELEYIEYVEKYFKDLIKESKITLSDMKLVQELNDRDDFNVELPKQVVCSIDDIQENDDNFIVPEIEE